MFDTIFSKFLIVLARQEQEAPLRHLGEGNDAATGSGADPSAAPQGGIDPMIMLMFLAIIMLALFVPSIIASRREKKKREEMLSSISKHDRVQTVGGVIGSVVEVKPNTVVLKVDESSNTRMTFARNSVQQVLTENPDKEKDAPAEASDAQR